MKREIANMLDWFLLAAWLVLLVMTILSDVGVLFPSERDYMLNYVAYALGIGSNIFRIIQRKTEIVIEVEEEEE